MARKPVAKTAKTGRKTPARTSRGRAGTVSGRRQSSGRKQRQPQPGRKTARVGVPGVRIAGRMKPG